MDLRTHMKRAPSLEARMDPLATRVTTASFGNKWPTSADKHNNFKNSCNNSTDLHVNHKAQLLCRKAKANLLTLCTTLFMISITTTSITHALNVNPKCQPTGTFMCNINGYNTWRPFNNTLGHTTLEDARSSLHKYAFLMTLPECENRVKLFLCSLYFPVCPQGPPELTTELRLPPCRDECEKAYRCEPHIRKAMKSGWPSEWDCSKFQYYSQNMMCVNDEPATAPSSSVSKILPSDLVNTQAASMNTQIAMPSLQPTTLTNTPPESLSVCGPEFFDCRLSDPKRPMCIEMRYVCDGKKDCYRNDSIYEPFEGSDEANCKERCDGDQLQCDDKCISRRDFCNGKVDCSSGLDEQDCSDNLTSLFQSIICIFVIGCAVGILVRFFRVERESEDKEQPYEASGGCHEEAIIEHKPYEQLPPPPPQLHQESMHDFLYQEPSILTTRGVYERIITGGYSGASSVYAYEPAMEPSRLLDSRSHSSLTPPPSKPTPPPPPPSRCSKIYENVED